MKRATLAALVLAIAVPTTKADAQVTLGVFGGMNRSDLSGDAPDDFSYKGKTAFAAGLIGELHLTDDVWAAARTCGNVDRWRVNRAVGSLCERHQSTRPDRRRILYQREPWTRRPEP
jgi:hypothetical protein